MGSLAERLASMAAVMRAGRPAVPLRERLAAGPAAIAVNVKQAALDRLRAVGLLAPANDNAVAPALRLFAGIETARVAKSLTAPPRGLFAGIDRAGVKKARAPITLEPGQRLAVALMQSLGEDGAAAYKRNTKVGQAIRRSGVSDTKELQRILKLPRRPADAKAFPDLTPLYAREGGTLKLWPIQSWALHEAPLQNGMLAPIGVGHGKTIISLLMVAAMKSKRAVLLIPSQLRAQLLYKDIPRLQKHFKLPLDKFKVVAYSELSNARSAEILEEIKPDLIVADECHALRHKTAARTKRFLRFFREHPECRFVGLSGTVTRRSIRDFAHLAELALRKNSPLPGGYHDLIEWAEAIDVGDDPMPPGALLQFCYKEEQESIKPTTSPYEIQKLVRAGFQRRLVETPGVVSTSEGAIGTSLVVNGLYPKSPDVVREAIEKLRKTWEIADEALMDAMSVARVARQLAAGFYYRWVWPDGVKDVEWLAARAAWHKEVREILKQSRKGLDSPLLVAQAAASGRIDSMAWNAWAEVKERPEPPTEAVWLSNFLVEESLRWTDTCSTSTPGIIWYQHVCVGEAIAAAGGLPFYGAGAAASERLASHDVKRQPIIVASSRAHATGKNLQDFSRNLVTTPSSGGLDWEQLLARTHRPGQLADEVWTDVFVHTLETLGAFAKAVEDARYIEQSQGQRQKLLYCQRLNLAGAE